MQINKTDKIIIVNLGGIGDVLLSQPALRALKQQTNAHVTLLVVPRVADLVRSWGFIDELMIVEAKFSLKMLQTLINIRKKQFDYAINMRTIHSVFSALKIKLVFMLISAKISCGRNTNGRASFFDIYINEQFPGDIHERDYCIQQVQQLDVHVEDINIRWDFTNAKKEDTDSIIIHPGAGIKSRCWPLTKFKEIIAYLIDKKEKKIIIDGSLNEKPMADYLLKEFGEGIRDYIGKTSILELAALLSRSKLLLTNDTGTMHIGASLNIPMIVLMSFGNIKQYDPRIISSNARIVYSEKYGKTSNCIEHIATAEVKKLIDELI